MQTAEIFAAIKTKFPDAIVEENTTNRDPYLKLKPEAILLVCRFLRTDPRLLMDYLACLSGCDYGTSHPLAVVYHVESIRFKHTVVLRVDLPRDHPVIESVTLLWRGANWHEREAFDLYGIEFSGHPNLKRILCAEDWVGFPLRKDYQYPTEYHGIPCPLTVHTLPDKDKQRH
ncbi:MAG: NADH-quinone oxidoreductase subunit C [Planctomycetes bacterium]|nr:NADH-quinone oxidoreductase subunit C [Planctomycetota bacterium]MBI3845240.1 NADH-quinone oxidoreductase subunit C [Planctomycetota bacterium]